MLCVRASMCPHVSRCACMCRYVSVCVHECIVSARELCACVSGYTMSVCTYV